MDAVIVERFVEECAIGQWPVCEIVGMGVMVVQISKRPERPTCLDPYTFRQRRIG
ncbi:MAG: hypothetical protein OSB46_01490 [Alphaproteobacteria bacterium]|nr:hypothetical protein [Alphaproteobacteria bacterium]